MTSKRHFHHNMFLGLVAVSVVAFTNSAHTDVTKRVQRHEVREVGPRHNHVSKNSSQTTSRKSCVVVDGVNECSTSNSKTSKKVTE